ncbi:DNA polymerase III subunit alpha [Zavarzinella formosa]|uniref:DNA polymerase III subunit alpha n=1 Tax=Zavarzinella formosa TaxID=360055 RepID=UPI0002F02891|nr:DNA polymerase III subunit alpha [Zavarzinella formosa]
MSRSFVHLHCHTHYSLLDGANRIPELVQQTKKQGMNAIAITDHGNLFGAVEFYRECKGAGLNPIIGYEAYMAPGSRHDKKALRQGDAYSHLTLLAKNYTGFKNLIKLSSIAWLEGFYYHPRIDRELLEAHSEGLICLSGCLAGEFNDLILRNETKKAKELAEWFEKVFKKDFYIEIQNNGLDLQDQCTVEAVRISQKVGIPLVATADAHYLVQADGDAHDVLFCINTSRKREPGKRNYPEGKIKSPYYVRTPEDMYAAFPKFADAVARSQEIADGVNIDIDFKKRYFPVFVPPENKKPEDYLRELCEQGMRERYEGRMRPEVQARLDHELGIICRMGFASYFLIVWDFVRFAREQGIPCSARGSGCGAVVAYVLYMSHVDPLMYDLLFERFLDPNRSEAPDIDIDFCQERREMVIDYVKQKYGEKSVAQICTFGTMAAKAAIKDVGRVLDIPLERVNYMTKWVSPKPGTSIEETLAASPEFRREYENDPLVREWIDIALKLEGTNRNTGTHAAGVVIANGPITDYVPVQIIKRKDESGETRQALTTQWVMGDIEKIGLLKMDFLGLRTLTLVDNSLQMIKKTRGVAIDLERIPMDDLETYKLLQKGDAKGVFQFESEGIRELLKRLKPDNIRDIIACTALYRPGPLEGGMVDEYIDCKHGRKKPVYPHPIVEELLSETYGVMVYQEQVMRILNRMGGLELSSAYACIKAISKKKEDIINARRVDFINGAEKQGMSREKADEIFGMIVKFGGYGFNKSHSAAYAYMSYHTAYLKRHYTAEFMAALLSSEVDDGNKRDIMVDHIADARRFGVPVNPPDVNRGEPNFTVKDGQIIFGLVAIKGLGRGAAEEIMRARTEGGPFKDLFEFSERVDTKTVSRSAIERLIKGGAMDGFAQPFAHRAQLLSALGGALQSAENMQEDRRRGQRSIFDMMGGDDETGEPAAKTNPPLPNIPRWSNTDQLKFEKEALDFYFSSHPLAEFEMALKRFATHTCQMVSEAKDGSQVRFGGMISQTRFMTTKKGNRYVRCKIEDFTKQLDCVMWPDDFGRYPTEFVDDKIYLFEAVVEDDQKSGNKSTILRKLMTLEQARKELTKAMILNVTLGQHGPDTVDRIGTILKRKTGTCNVFMVVKDGQGRTAQFRLGDDYRVNPAEVPLEELELLIGAGSVMFSGR